MDKFTVLKDYFGYSLFRSGQESLIDSILEGRDTLGIMPTGAGKSICFQVPAMLQGGITLVVSPLISLMKDQVTSLTQAGIPAAFLNSSLTLPQYRKVLDNLGTGKYKIIYVAPERLLTDGFVELAKSLDISMVTVDEAHCISQWGQDFRPSYLKIAEFLTTLPRRPVLSAFTATATTKVRDDIIAQLALEEPFVLTTGFDRKNLYFGVEKPKDKLASLKAYVSQHAGQCGIVYCATRKNVEEVYEALKGMGTLVTRYHAGLEDEERRTNQEDFIYDRANVVVATNAFGMGIDKSNVSYVIHYNMPKNMESYYQEAGRAGRDGEPAECILYYSGQDVITNQFLIDKSNQNEELTFAEVEAIREKDRALLKTMTFYCHTQDCLRSYILRYFGETAENFCGNCSNCKSNFVEEDITVEAQKILSCVKRMGERYGMKLVVDTLRGSKNQRVLQLHMDSISTYGLMKDTPESKVRDMIHFLILHGYLATSPGDYPVLMLTPTSSQVLFQGKQLKMKVLKSYEVAPKGKKEKTGKKAIDHALNPELFGRLRELRWKLAKAQNVPPYIVFTDTALRDMCAKMPVNDDEFLQVSGVGQTKLERYGEAFLSEILDFLTEEGTE